jgi:hypothetical protein
VRALPADFLDALDGQEEVLVSSRDGDRVGTVPVAFIVEPPGVVYVFTLAFSEKARRWRHDPWVRLRVPGTRIATEATAFFVEGDELEEVGPRIVEHWGMQGATTIEGLRRTVRDRTHALIRIEAPVQDA